MKPDVVVGDVSTLGEALNVEFVAQGQRALDLRGTFKVALSGGSLATHFFPRLACVSFDWSRTEFFWADERAVPPSDPESNYAIAQSMWLGPAKVPPANIHRMRGEDPDLQRAARDYADQLLRVAGSPPRLDYVMLGAGPDGHIASLFAGHPVLQKTNQLVAAVEDSPKPPPRRLTLTMPVLVNARRVAVVALGTEKAEAVRDALERDAPTPLGRLVAVADNISLLLDEQAASLLANKVE